MRRFVVSFILAAGAAILLAAPAFADAWPPPY